MGVSRARALAAGGAALAIAFAAAPAFADDYPPATYGQGSVDRSVVHPGECVHFSGGGFAGGAALSVTDNNHPSTTGTADRDGRFRVLVCFDTNATLGRHELAARGEGANTAPRTVTAAVTVQGLTETGGSTQGGHVQGGKHAHGAHGGSHRGAFGGRLPFTGGFLLELLAAALALLVAGLLLTKSGRRRRAHR